MRCRCRCRSQHVPNVPCSTHNSVPPILSNRLTALRPGISGLLADIHSLPSCPLVRLGRVNDAFLDIGRQAVEGLVDVRVGLGRDLKERDA